VCERADRKDHAAKPECVPWIQVVYEACEARVHYAQFSVSEMSICPYDAFQAILVELASGDVFRICDAITLFRQQLTTSTYIRFTTSKRWQTAWRVILETVGYENLKFNDAKDSETSTSSRTRETNNANVWMPTCFHPFRRVEDTESKTVQLFLLTHSCLFSRSRDRET
jgi:hypothetical protein